MDLKMDKASFTEWLDNPVTEYFIQYLKDSAKEESTMVSDMILDGVVVPLDDQIRICTLSMTLTQISDISFDEIDDFYSK